jgi:hypothetical protein
VSPVKYELGVYIPEDDILHSPFVQLLDHYDMKTYGAVALNLHLWRCEQLHALVALPSHHQGSTSRYISGSWLVGS